MKIKTIIFLICVLFWNLTGVISYKIISAYVINTYPTSKLSERYKKSSMTYGSALLGPILPICFYLTWPNLNTNLELDSKKSNYNIVFTDGFYTIRANSEREAIITAQYRQINKMNSIDVLNIEIINNDNLSTKP